MTSTSLGNNIKYLRSIKKQSQKDFAEFLDIPQPSLSAYENDRNSPTADVLLNISQKCKVSIDWLCGASDSKRVNYTFSHMGDVSYLLYFLMEVNELKIDIERIKTSTDDEPTFTTNLKINGTDPGAPLNKALCLIIDDIESNMKNNQNPVIYNYIKNLAYEEFKVAPVTLKNLKNTSQKDLEERFYNLVNNTPENTSEDK